MVVTGVGGLQMRNRFIFLNEVDSTNDYAKQHLKDLEDGTIISAKIQNAGRGQFDRIWLSSEEDIKISLVIKQDIDTKNIYDFSLLPAAALLRLLHELNIRAQIKWPNDIIVNDRKIAGILVETSFVSNKLIGIIIGVGLNISDDNKVMLKHQIICLKELIKVIPSRNDVIKDFIRHFNDFFDDYLHRGIEEILDFCNENSYL